MNTKPLPATERAALILQLVPYLISQGEVSVADAAADFDVTPEQMKTMVETLTVIGLPGDGGFWQMANDLFDIDWDLLDEQQLISITNTVGLERTPRLTTREAAALLAGLQVAAALPGVGSSEAFQGLLTKLSRGAAGTPADVIVVPGRVDDVRLAVSDAVQRGMAVSFTYRAPDAEPTTRTVDPIKVHIAEGQWYLQGWCHLREASRTFHLDRVSDLTITDVASTHGIETATEGFGSSDYDVEAEVRVAEALRPLLGGLLSGAVEITPGRLRIHVADEHGLKRLAARHSGNIEVLSPASARDAALRWAQAGLDLYDSPSSL